MDGAGGRKPNKKKGSQNPQVQNRHLGHPAPGEWASVRARRDSCVALRVKGPGRIRRGRFSLSGHHGRTDAGIARALRRGLILVVEFECALHENLVE